MREESKNTSSKNFITNIDSSRFKSRTNSDEVLSQFEDPTYLGFKLFFTGINNNSFGGLLGGPDNTNSARYYLKSIGDDARYKMLDTFINLLQKINNEYPWYFQSISGLDEAWKKRTTLIPRIKGNISIECLEALDLRMTSLIDLYRKSVHDWTNFREILTDNLRHFEVDIMVYDNRTFNTSLKGDTINQIDGGDTSRPEQVNETFFGGNHAETTNMIFHLSYCTINLESGSEMFSSVGNKIGDKASQSISIDYESIEESGLYKILTMLYRSDDKKFWYVKDYVNNIVSTLSTQSSSNFNLSNLGGAYDQTYNANIYSSLPKQNKEKLISNQNINDSSAKEQLAKAKQKASTELGNATDNFLIDLKKDVSSQALGIVKSQLSKLFLGNVYDLSASTILAKGALGNVRSITDQSPLGEKRNNLGNIF